MRFTTRLALGLLACALATGSVAKAANVVIDVSGWETWGGFGDPSNSETFLNLGVGSVVTGFDYDVTFESFSPSWTSEVVLSANDSTATSWLDWAPSTSNAAGVFSGVGSWNGPNGQPGPFGDLQPVVLNDGILWFTVYESFIDGSQPDARFASGSSVTVYYNPVPEPATWGLLGLGTLGLFLARRRFA